MADGTAVEVGLAPVGTGVEGSAGSAADEHATASSATIAATPDSDSLLRHGAVVTKRRDLYSTENESFLIWLSISRSLS